MPVVRAEAPLTCVAFGSGAALDHFDQLTQAARRGRMDLVTPDWRTTV
jgi:actin-like ATPase involved in cell morphogenesis